jgi:hypothetical protein
MFDRKRPLTVLPHALGLVCIASITYGCSSESPDGGCLNTRPYKSGWETVFDGQIAVSTGENFDVTELKIGGTQSGGNFINRGDIEVYQSLAPAADGDNPGIGQMIVQMNKFTFACDDAEAVGDGDNPGRFSRIQPWLFASNSLVPPTDPDLVGAECNETNGFLAGCQIRVYYDGQTQPIRDGADIRVFLPSDFAGKLILTTDDNIGASTYLDRSDVTVDGLQGRLEVTMDSGIANVKIADNAIPAPGCGADLNTACAEYTDPVTDEALPWSPNCPCSAENLNSVKIDSRGNEAMNATVDAPADYWTNASLNNVDELNSIATGQFCDVDIACDGFDTCDLDSVDCNDLEKPWKCTNSGTNFPAGALSGTGVTVNITSEGCDTVQYHEGPNGFNTTPLEEKRGLITLCSGCLDGVVDVPTP